MLLFTQIIYHQIGKFSLKPIADQDKKSIPDTTVAAILDTIKQRRAHFAQSSDDDDDDEQDWDD